MGEFVPFRFEVNLYWEDTLLCSGRFSEVSGIEFTMEPRAISEGGRNWGELQRVGQTKFSPVVLKRGVTNLNDLWLWFEAVNRGADYSSRVEGEIIVMGSELEQGEAKPIMLWWLTGVLPTRFKSADLSSTASQVAIEELTLVHEGMSLYTQR